MLQQLEDWLYEVGAAQSNICKLSTLDCGRKKKKTGAHDREGPWHSQSRRLNDEHLCGKRLVTLCELLNINRVDGRPSSAPKLANDTEYISRASRALAAVTLLKRATASETAVHSGPMQEMWIDGYNTEHMDG